MKKNLEEIIKEELGYLFTQFDFIKTDYSYDAKMFGNEGLRLSNGKTMISFTKDRDQIFVHFGHSGIPRSKWYNLSIILKAKGISGVQAYNLVSNKGAEVGLEEQATYLSEIIQKYCGDLLSNNWEIESKIFLAKKEKANEVIKELTKTKK